MNTLRLLSFPYSYLISPWIGRAVPVVMLLSLAAVILDWVLPAPDRRRGRLTLLLVAVNLFLCQDQFMSDKKLLDAGVIAAGALCLLAYGILFRDTIRRDWLDRLTPLPFWIGLAVILIITTIKLVDLSTWPPFLKSYAAMTGRWGLRAVEGEWPGSLFQGRGFDLRGGGESPLILPVMWLVMKCAGVTVFSVRLSEVIGSTILLVVFWAWLRRSLPGIWAPVALMVFGLSPWHIAQSRMGTFFSISAAIAVGLLWTAQQAWRAETLRGVILWWALLGAFAGAIGWCYAPMKVLYLFFVLCLILIPLLRRFKPRHWWAGTLASILIFGAFLGLQMASVQVPSSMFKSHFGPLATDNPVWRKTADDRVEPGRQPVPVIAANLKRNAVQWMQLTFREHGILPLYAPSLIAAMVIAGLCLILRWHPILTLYFFIGILPPLIVFPLHRRSLIIWPLVYVTAVVVLREITVAGATLFRKQWLRRLVPSLVGVCIVLMVLQGFQILTSTWSIVKDHTYFGPPWRLRAMDRAAELMPTHKVVFINPWVHRDTIDITLYELNKQQDFNALSFAYIGKNARGLQRYLDPVRPTAFIYFDLDNQGWLKPLLKREFPGIRIQEIRNKRGRRELLYSVLQVE